MRLVALRHSLLCILVVSVASFAWAQADSSAKPDQSGLQQRGEKSDSGIRGSIPTILSKSLDSKKLKEGDPITCQTIAALHSGSGIMIPSGSKVIGHVTKAQARSKGDSDSSLGFVFDKIEIGKGEALPINGALQAVAPGLNEREITTGAAGPPALAGRGDAPGSAGTSPGPQNLNIAGGSTGHPVLIPSSQGVLGVKNLQMSPDGLLTSTGKEVKLDGGTQILIRASAPAPAQ